MKNCKFLLKIFIKSIKKYWKKIRSNLGKKFTKEPTYKSDRHVYINTRIREYGSVIRTAFRRNNVSKALNENVSYKCFPLIKLESEENLFYLQTILGKCKYDVENAKRNRGIVNEFERSASDESDSELDTSSDDGSDDDKEFLGGSENNESN